MNRSLIVSTAAALSLFGLACSDDTPGTTVGVETSTTGDGDGDPATGDGDGDGDPTGDGDGDATGDGDGDGDATGDGDGDGDATGDGDGDGDATGDGDGAGDATGDGDGDGDATGDGDGDGDATGDGDGDGDATGDGDGDGDPDCQAPPEHITCDAADDDPTPLQAIGLNCDGDQTNSTPTTADSFNSPDAAAWQIAAQYGTSGDWVPSEGDQLLVISSGRVPAPNNGIINSNGNNQQTGNPDNVQLPAPMTADMGSNNGAGGNPFNDCDGVGDCSDSLEGQWMLGGGSANDLLWFDFSVDVPGGTSGWLLDFVYFSNEFPEYVDSQFNDIFVVWEVSESYVGNICFIDGEPCTVTALDAVADDFSGVDDEGGHPSLAGTGCQGVGSTGGQTTGWVSLEGPATPNENMELTFAVFDMGDTGFDTMVVMDNWRWNCQGCTPNEVTDCGVQPQ